MVPRSLRTLMAVAALLIAGAAAGISAPAPSPGSVTGRLTDTRSTPLENIRLTLRNTATGAEIQAITGHGGRYHFTGLPPGEYELTAPNSQGEARFEGIVVSAGHESQIQAAVELRAAKAEIAAEPAHRDRPHSPRHLTFTSTPTALQSRSATIEYAFAAEIVEILPIDGRKHSRFEVNQTPEIVPPPVLDRQKVLSNSHTGEKPSDIAGLQIPHVSFLKHAEIGLEISPVSPIDVRIPEVPLKDLNVASISLVTQAAHTATSDSALSLSQEQFQALPLRGRDWQSFVAGTPAALASSDNEERSADDTQVHAAILVDGVPIRNSFDTRSPASHARLAEQPDPGSAESSIATVSQIRSGEKIGSALSGDAISIETQRGTEHLHGQAFGFNRQDFLNARNPFTQWVKETPTGSSGAVPSFSAQPYSPADRATLWGVGIGGVLLKPRLFWFAALDGSHRNDPGIATVKHPENFFAQPSNDRMQLLSAQLGVGSSDPVTAGLHAYSKLLEDLAQLLGPTPRSSSQLKGFGRVDWSARERNRFTLEATASALDSPGGGLTRASEHYGTHSFGSVRSQQQWTLARWNAFITPNLLATSGASFAHEVRNTLAQAPSPFEKALNINAWGQLPQIVIDSRDGFTIGTPARFGRSTYPDQRRFFAQEQISWVRGDLMLKGGVEISHDRDATTGLRNQTGTYYYSSVEDFASDALAFSAFGISGQLDPMHQHNCDQRGGPWRDSTGVLHGLGYLPCYSYYSQTMGPSNWWLATKDWASYVTAQLQPSETIAFTLAVRWELQQLPPAIPMLNNPDLPLTKAVPALGNQWGPRAAFAWGKGEGRWPVLRAGYGMYFARTPNSVVETALTQTGSLKGDLDFFMRPTDNLAGGGAPPFPYVLAGAPATAVKPAAVEFAPHFRNGEVHQAEAGIEENLPGHIRMEASAVASLARRLPVTFDANIDPAANPKTITYLVDDGTGSGPIKSPQITVPFFASWPSVTSRTGFAGRLNPNYQQVSQVFSRANSTYEAAVFRVVRNSRTFMFRGRYTYAHAMDWNPDETSQLGPSTLDPVDFRQEYGTSALDVRHSATVSVILRSKWRLKNPGGHIGNGWQVGAIGNFHSGLPFSMRTAGSLPKEFNLSGTAIVGLGTGMNGYGGDNRVYGVPRNAFRYPATWKADLRLSKRFELGEMRQLELMAESFNLFNHQNVTQVETTGYSIAPGTHDGALPRLIYLTGLKTGQTEFGKPLNINGSDLYRERQIQFGARVRF